MQFRKVFLEKPQRMNNILTLLNFIKKQQCLTWNNWYVKIVRQSLGYGSYIPITLKERGNFGILFKTNF